MQLNWSWEFRCNLFSINSFICQKTQIIVYVCSFQYGGGKVIRPGDELETKEAKEAKEKRSRELIAVRRDWMLIQNSQLNVRRYYCKGIVKQQISYFDKNYFIYSKYIRALNYSIDLFKCLLQCMDYLQILKTGTFLQLVKIQGHFANMSKTLQGYQFFSSRGQYFFYII